jgi:hypothetical protein
MKITRSQKAVTIGLSALTQFAIVSGGAVMALMANGDVVTNSGWIVAGITGLVAVAKDLRTQMNLEPVSMPVAESVKKGKSDVE